MKQKLLLFALALFAFTGNMMAQDDNLTFSDVEIMPGKTAILEIGTDFASTNIKQSFQIEFQLPEGFEIPILGYEENPETHKTEPTFDIVFDDSFKAKYTNFLPKWYGSVNNGMYKVISFSMSNSPLATGQYPVAKVKLKCAENIEPGEYTVNTSYIELVKTDNTKINPQTSFKITVVPYKARDLYDNITDVEENTGKIEDVIVHRSFAKDKWATICLPFAMNVDQMEKVFGEETKLASFANYKDYADTDNITIMFESVTDGIEANYPYIICPTQDVENIFVEDVVVAPDEEEALEEYNNDKTGNKKVTYAQFIGTLKQGNFVDKIIDKYHTVAGTETSFLFISDSKFYVTTNPEKTIKAYRGYFWVDRVEDSYGSANICIMVDGETTAIEGITSPKAESVDGNVYTVSGVNMGRAEDVMESLPSGIYIVNNKKVIVK